MSLSMCFCAFEHILWSRIAESHGHSVFEDLNEFIAPVPHTACQLASKPQFQIPCADNLIGPKEVGIASNVISLHVWWGLG